MDNELKIFTNEEFGSVRTVTIDGEPWFVGKDVAEALGYRDTVNALKKHVDNDDKIMGCQNATPSITDGLGRIQHPTWINESGVYTLIFGSKLPSAKKFKRWVTSEVIPSIRKHGAYMTEQTLEQALMSPDFLVRLATQLKEEHDARRLAEQTIEEQKPLVYFANKVSDSSNLIDMGMMAKLLKDENIEIGRNRLFSWLRRKEILMENNIPYQRYIDNGYFRVKEYTYSTPYGIKTQQTTYVIGKGQIFITEKLRQEWNKS